MPLLKRKVYINVKNEVTKGTKESSALVGLMVYDPVINPTAEFNERNRTGKFNGNL